MRRSAPGIAAAAALALSLSACGTTVHTGLDGASGESDLGGGLSSSAPDSTLTGTGTTGGTGGFGTTGTAAGSATGGSTTALGGSTSGSTGGGTSGSSTSGGGSTLATEPALPTAAALKNGPGISSTEINVGFAYAPNSDAEQAALGGSSSDADLHADAQAIIADINKHGGVAGRKINPIYYTVDATSNQSESELDSAACAYFTQDHHVLVAMPLTDSDFDTCLDKAGAVDTTASLAGYDDATYKSIPNTYDVQALSTTQIANNLAVGLKNAGYFTGWNASQGKPGNQPVKVGILSPDSEQWVNVTSKVLVPALARVGIKVDSSDVEVWHFPTSNAGDAQSISQIQAAVLKFRSDGVTHVIPTEINSISFFATEAAAQKYRPRYGISTADEIPAEAGGLIPYSQLAGAIGIGWSPSVDLPSSTSQSATYAGPGTTHCMSVMKAANVPLTTDTAKTLALAICDEFNSVKYAIDAIPKGQPINLKTYMAALATLGTTFPIAALPKARFSPGRPYPVTEAWTMQYEDGCECLAYKGSPFSLS